VHKGTHNEGVVSFRRSTCIITECGVRVRSKICQANLNVT